MTIDLSQFHQVFYEESFEGLDVMESALMELDPANIDSETINAIFRSAHSIKGGSATFGFTSVSEFTHDLETILDQVRSGNRVFRGEDVNLCLKSVDCMREMLQLLQAGEDGKTQQSEELKQVFARMLAGEEICDDSTESISASVSLETGAERPSDSKTWAISFAPDVGILKTGNDVLRMFRELSELGTLENIRCSNRLPELKSIDPESCYLQWNMELTTDSPKDLIAEVFEWVADESDLRIEPRSAHTGWHIVFKPDENILRTGNEPARLFSALRDLGEMSIEAHTDRIPSLRLIDHEYCFLWWEITLADASIDQNAIEEIFEWVIEESDITISRLGTGAVPEEKAPLVDTPVSSGDATAAVVPIIREVTPPQDLASSNAPSEPVAPVSQVSSRPAANAPKKAVETGSIRVGIDKVDNLINMVGELVITQSMLGQLGTDFDVDRVPKLLEGLGQLEQNTRELQESVMRIRMLPISFAFSRFPRMVRDLSQSLGKELHLEMLGEQTELDKTVMEKIGDPLVHLVRNAVDHGIEMPDERKAKGKSATGRITLNAYHQGGNVVIEISDDGKGLDREKIVSKAIEKNLISMAEADTLNDDQVFDLIFHPGFSTAQAVSDLSGRGVGMDVVKRNIQALNGIVEIRSEKDKGSTITIRLPLTLAILDGQLVRVGQNTYIFPLVSIIESLQCRREFINKVAGGCDVFKLRDDYVPIIELYKTFSVKPDTTDLDQSLIVVVECDGDKVGIVVDELQAQQQVVIKSLEQNYKRVDGISGATILGDGTVALILDIVGIVKLAGEKFNQTVTRKSTAAQSSINLSQLAS